MQRRDSFKLRIRVIAAACALALATGVAAQTADPQADEYAGVAGARQPKARGLFAMTIATLVAQGVGSGIASGLSQGITGSIAKWFANPSGGPVTAAFDDLSPRTEPEQPAPALHAGVAYEVHVIGREARPVDPKTHVFRTGDQFQVYYRPTLPGRVAVSNINPKGSEATLDAVEVAAGQLLVLGPYQFVDKQGDETLRIVLSPCSTPTLMAATRSIVKVSATNGDPVRIADCGSPRTRALSKKVRDIRRTAMEGTTAFALDRVSDEELASGELASRETRIRLAHR
jgi:hypothetical protein